MPHRDVTLQFPDFPFDPLTTVGYPIIDLKADGPLEPGFLRDHLPGEILDGINYEDFIYDHLATESAAAPEGTLGVSTRLARQRFELIQLPMVHVTYAFAGKSYELLIWGPNFEVYSTTDPFSERFHHAFEQGVAAFEKKRYGEALTAFQQARLLSQDAEYQEKVAHNIALCHQHMQTHMIRGSRLGTVVSMVAMVYLTVAHFLTSPRFFDAEIIKRFRWQEMAPYHPYVVSTVFVLVALFVASAATKTMAARLAPRFPAEGFRVAVGFSGAALAVLAAWAAVMALNGLGATLYLSGIIDYGVQVASSVVAKAAR